MTSTSNQELPQSNESITCVVVGDGCVGKTSLLVSFIERKYLPSYVPTVFVSYNTTVKFNKGSYDLQITDTSGQMEYDRLRSLVYSEASCVLLCFSLADRVSFENIEKFWIKELHTYGPTKPFILVGLKKDLRYHHETCTELRSCRNTPISYKEGSDLAKKLRKLNCRKYTECSAQTSQGTTDVFDEVVLTVNEEKWKKMKRTQACRIL